MLNVYYISFLLPDTLCIYSIHEYSKRDIFLGFYSLYEKKIVLVKVLLNKQTRKFRSKHSNINTCIKALRVLLLYGLYL